jgi:hypothetical protein
MKKGAPMISKTVNPMNGSGGRARKSIDAKRPTPPRKITLRKLGWSDGRNVRVEVQWSSTEMDRIRGETAAVVGSAPDVIVISSNGALAILLRPDLGPRWKRIRQ